VIEKGQVTVDGRLERSPGATVGPAARIVWDPNRPALPRARASLPLLYADEALVIVDKPAGLLAVPSETGSDEDTVLARVRDYVVHLHPRRPYVGLVHRLDRDTSGALCFALTPPARDALRDLFRAHRIERRYVALVEGQPAGEAGEIDLPIHEDYVSGRRRVARGGEPSLRALTRWRLLERLEGASLLELELETGRQHQIRLHLAHIGLPVLGDPVYREVADRTRRGPDPRRPPPRPRPAPARAPRPAPRLSVRAPRQMLHARVLGVTHPGTGATVRVESPLPADFRAVLEALRRRRRA
jgi:23S rRNA pseudouridine1911/1915/1917 synthase